MTAEFDRFLESGDSIVYRAAGRENGPNTLGVAIIMIAFVPMMAAAGFTTSSIFGEPVGESLRRAWLSAQVAAAMALLGTSASWVWARIAARRRNRDPDLVVVTNTRFFYQCNAQDRLETMALSDIDNVACLGTIHILGDGRRIDLPRMKDHDRVADAIAKAAGVQPPPPVGRMVATDEYVVAGVNLVTAVSLIGFLVGFRALGLVSPGEAAATGEFLAPELSIALVAGLAIATGIVLGPLFGTMTRIAILHRFVSPAEMSAGLRGASGNKWFARAVLKWAAILYGHRWRGDFV